MNPTKNVTQVSVPAWAKPKKADRYTLFEAAALLGFEGRWVRMSAADQRALLGFAVFGKRAFRVNADGIVEVIRSTCFGSDYELGCYAPGFVVKAAVDGKQLAPGYTGPAFAQ
jgi:hypothetical protein